ncbi:uncharacterized protein LOC124540368 [Vanessa cardui]|uniref:uncharacterized protein LOC124540368 n=1 Tax=Vanessa cardui TaxID=171605 RepID=UPI001F148270|nr:uncharacterized protein LOC124540368 [Vanessa cardui]
MHPIALRRHLGFGGTRVPPVSSLLDSGSLSRASLQQGATSGAKAVEGTGSLQSGGATDGHRQAAAVEVAEHEGAPQVPQREDNGDSGSGSAEEEASHQTTSATSRRLTEEDTATSSNKLSAQAETVVQAESKDGNYFPVRVLLDQGSQGSFITKAMVQQLGLKRLATKNTVVGIGGNKSATSKSTVKVTLRSRVDPKYQVQVIAHVLKSVTSLLPVAKTTRMNWENLTLDELADPDYHTPNRIDILLGAEIYSQIIQEGIKRNLNGSLLAQDTVFGWIISGVCDIDSTSNIHSQTIVMHSYLEVDNMLKKFWELEAEPPLTKKMLTDDDIKCEKLFQYTTKRDKDGRFIVRLPFRTINPDCVRGEFKNIAEKRFRSLEFKLQKNIQLKEDYKQVIKEYLNLNHMVKVTVKDKCKKTAIYLTHHAVVREVKETTKVRVVFDASCKGGISYRKNLTALQNIKIPRWIHTCNKYKRELYGFSDASKVAYAAVVYLRVVDEVGNVIVSLVTAKTKVAPIKRVSSPRLELCGAVLLAKLMVEVAEVMEVERSQLHAFTDSEVVLAWLNHHPSRWKTFVANRVSEILQILDTHHWSHVATKKNPADLASRDSEGIIRVGGRLEMSSLSFNEKHPILIPKESCLSALLIADAHQKTLHGGPQLMITYLRSKYWIIHISAHGAVTFRACDT